MSVVSCESCMLQDDFINAGCACTGLAVPHHNLGLQIAHGPLSIAIGLAAGILLGFVCALTPVWSSPLRRAVALLAFGELLAFCGCVLHCCYRLRSLARSLAHSLTSTQLLPVCIWMLHMLQTKFRGRPYKVPYNQCTMKHLLPCLAMTLATHQHHML